MEVTDPDRLIALAYAGRTLENLRFLFLLDEALGRVVTSVREPVIAQMKLAWWRENLGTDAENVKKGEPLLGWAQAIGLGAKLVPMVNGWEGILAELPLSDADLSSYADARGGTLFAVAAHLCGQGGQEQARQAGQNWALADFAFRCTDPLTRDRALALAAEGHERPMGLPVPLGILSALAQSDLKRGPKRRWRPGSPMRMLRALGYWVFRR